ncbi:putative P-type phospholipid transporter [Helianthus annuus]|nr:putative P-type phospholipid transporter [Helianthus annuus]
MGNGLYCSLIVFFLNIIIFYDQAFWAGGQTADMTVLGTAMFTCVIYAVNCQIALTMSHFTWIQHFLIGFSIIAWYVFLILYGMMPPEYSGNAFRIFVEALAPAPLFWLTTILVTVACNLPYLAHISFQRSFSPMDHHIIQEIKYYKKDVEDRHMWTRERSKARQETKIGFTARVDAKIRHFKQMLQKKSSVLSPRVALAATRT